VILVKRQTNGKDRIILKRDATIEDVRAEALRLQRELGYELKMDGKGETCQLVHRSYRGEFLLALEADDSPHWSPPATLPLR
jgi:hypothetical protein